MSGLSSVEARCMVHLWRRRRSGAEALRHQRHYSRRATSISSSSPYAEREGASMEVQVRKRKDKASSNLGDADGLVLSLALSLSSSCSSLCLRVGSLSLDKTDRVNPRQPAICPLSPASSLSSSSSSPPYQSSSCHISLPFVSLSV